MEATNADNARNPFQARHHASAAQRHGADHLPGMFAAPEEQNGSLPFGDGQVGRGGLVLLALWLEGSRVFR